MEYLIKVAMVMGEDHQLYGTFNEGCHGDGSMAGGGAPATVEYMSVTLIPVFKIVTFFPLRDKHVHVYHFYAVFSKYT